MPSGLAHTSIRLADEYREAIESRSQRLAGALAAFDQAVADEDREASAGELLASAAVADEEYKRRVDRAVLHLIAGDQEHTS